MSNPAWAVVAAILIIEDGELHYTDLAKRVVESRLSSLGDMGGQDTAQTLGSIMRKNDFFTHSPYGQGFYKLSDKKCIHMDEVSPIIEYYLSKYMDEYKILVGKTFRKNIEYGNIPFNNDFISEHERIIQLEKIFHRFSGIPNS